MCLSVSTSRKPLFTTAYKIMRKEHLGVDKRLYAHTLFNYGSLLINGEWNVNKDSHIKLYYEEGDYFYKCGFHSFVNLEDAIRTFKDVSEHHFEVYGLYEVDTDDITQYGVERHWYLIDKKYRLFPVDVVVSNKIKFVQRII